MMTKSVMTGSLMKERSSVLLRRAAALPWWVHVLLVYGGSRVLSTVLLTAAAARQGPSAWADASPSYLEYVNFWDSGWYERIHDGGYPGELPRGDSGEVLQNQWAFYPVFPAMVRLVTWIFGVGWNPTAPLLAMLFGAAAALLVYRLFRLRADHRNALWGVALVVFFPVAAILQIPYAESLHLMLLAGALYLVMSKRYLTAVPVVLVMCLTRPAGVPFTAMLGVLLLVQLVGHHRNPERVGELVRLTVLTVAACFGALAWPFAAWMTTGVPSAYVQTETAWRGTHLTPFQPWLDVSVGLLGPVLGPLTLLVLAAGAVVVLLSGPARQAGMVLQLWCGAYLLYLAAFWHPQTSTFRILLPLFPLALVAVLASRSRAYRWVLLAAFAAFQLVWIVWLWSYAPLPGGGDYSP